MFTGIVEELGRVKEMRKTKDALRLSISADEVTSNTKIGDSISVNGTCLTVVSSSGNTLCFDVVGETVKRTNLSFLKAGDRVNLEQALKLGGRLGGHLVSGHIDGLGRIRRITRKGENHSLEIEVPAEVIEYIISKGSVALDGVSLTVGEVEADCFRVYIIPHTLKITTLGLKGVGAQLNIEVDMVGKYVRKFAGLEKEKKGITREFLKEQGFL